MSNRVDEIKMHKKITPVQSSTSLAPEKLDRIEQIRKKKLIESSYPYEEHGL